jgi:sporulation protein YlmC with PRC-barrel domain
MHPMDFRCPFKAIWAERRASMFIKGAGRCYHVAVFLMVLLLGTYVFSGTPEADETNKDEGLRLTVILDHPVQNSKGRQVAKVDDLIIRRHGRIKKAVPSTGEVLGLDGKVFTVPFRSLRFNGKGVVVSDLTREDAEKRPAFSYRLERLRGDYYNWDYPRGGVYSGGHYFYYPERPWAWSYYPGLMFGSAILGRKVFGERGKEIGRPRGKRYQKDYAGRIAQEKEGIL